MGALHITFIDEKQKDTSMRRNFVEGIQELFDNDPDLMGGRMIITVPYAYKGRTKTRRFKFFEGDDIANENEFLNLQEFLQNNHDPLFNKRSDYWRRMHNPLKTNLNAERAWGDEEW